MNAEQDLRDLQPQLARAWVERDRPYIDSVLAAEWKVTQSDGTILSRADVLRAAFESDALRVTTMVIDEVTVVVLGTTAIVRGRTEAAGVVNGAAVTARLRFTDVFLNRGGRWQAVASHASGLSV
jgi:hypothetical protein